MSYTPTIYCGGKAIYSGDKFYKYINGLEKLDSIKWLVKHNKIEDELDDPKDLIFNYAYLEPKITFTAEEFREFITLYEKDINDYDFTGHYISYDKPFKFKDHWDNFEEIFNNDKDKIIWWD